MTIVLPDIHSIQNAVPVFWEAVGSADKLLFYGEIGAGKTTFIKALCADLQVRENVSSPTFSIINEYSYVDSQTGKEKVLYHIDLYRLKHIEEALDIGIEEYLYSDAYCFIEWPQMIESILPDNSVKIKMEMEEDSTRKMLIL